MYLVSSRYGWAALCLSWGDRIGHWWGPGIGLHSPQDLGPGLQELAPPVCSVETNMVMVKVDRLPPEELCGRLQDMGSACAAVPLDGAVSTCRVAP